MGGTGHSLGLRWPSGRGDTALIWADVPCPVSRDTGGTKIVSVPAKSGHVPGIVRHNSFLGIRRYDPHPIVGHSRLVLANEGLRRSCESVLLGVLVLTWHCALIEAVAPPVGGDGREVRRRSGEAGQALTGAQVLEYFQRALGMGWFLLSLSGPLGWCSLVLDETRSDRLAPPISADLDLFEFERERLQGRQIALLGDGDGSSALAVDDLDLGVGSAEEERVASRPSRFVLSGVMDA